jgi:hypothetical protein
MVAGPNFLIATPVACGRSSEDLDGLCEIDTAVSLDVFL